jgi:hypothetical protein
MEIECESKPNILTLDREWLSIMKATDSIQSHGHFQGQFPRSDIQEKYLLILIRNLSDATKFIKDTVKDDMLVPPYFIKTALEYGNVDIKKGEFPIYRNPQTEELCKLVGIKSKINQDGVVVERPREETLEEAKKRLLFRFA